MDLGLLVTARCNAQCTHCATSCGPRRSEALPQRRIFSLMDEAAEIRREIGAGEPLHFALSGGEVFLDFPQLLEICAYGKRLGATVSCVTNAYWAASDDKARELLVQVRAAGLTHIAASTSRFHQRWVKVERVHRALRIARQIGLHTMLKCAETASDTRSGWGERLADAIAPDEREIFPVVAPLREGGTLPPAEFTVEQGLPAGRCPVPVLTVREDGKAYTCCTPGGFAPLLELGDVHESGLAAIRERYYLGGTQQILFRKGPIHFARRAIAQGHGARLRKAYAGVCDLCAHIAADPPLAALAAAEGEAHERRQLRQLFGDVLRPGRARRRKAA